MCICEVRGETLSLTEMVLQCSILMVVDSLVMLEVLLRSLVTPGCWDTNSRDQLGAAWDLVLLGDLRAAMLAEMGERK